MASEQDRILAILDRCSDSYTFPMLDNGYVYLAATRLSLYRSAADWALAIEVFGYSFRNGIPDTYIQTFASCLHNRDTPENYVSRAAYEQYLVNKPNNDYRTVYPIEEGSWLDPDDGMSVVEGAGHVVLRGQAVPLPPVDEYARHGIDLEAKPRVQVFELCRYLAAVSRDQVLATPDERRVSVRPEMELLLQLEEWHHPDLVVGERPSGSETFQQLARVLGTGDVTHYRPMRPPNTHWRHWPEGGRL
ncbi:MAG TPA: hypothetical protein VD866_21515 [Urbifossiella sp.]|nr:hypothetical protein [Urbifossiella sp.]